MTTHTRLDATKTVVLEHPYNPQRLRLDNPNVSLPEVLTPEVLDHFNVVEIVEVEAPVPTLDTRVEELHPTRHNNVWTQQWTTHKVDHTLTAERLKIQRDRLWTHVKNTRGKRFAQGSVCVDGNWFSTDLISRAKYHSFMVQAMSAKDSAVLQAAGEDVLWKLMDNQLLAFTVGMLKAVMKAIDTFDAETFNYAEKLKVTIYKSKNPIKVDIVSGWPKIYGE